MPEPRRPRSRPGNKAGAPRAGGTEERQSRPLPGAVSVGQLYRGRARLALIRDLAMGEWSTREIAEQLGVEHTDILMFQEENVSDIAEVKAALTGQLAIETAGLWVAKKHNRIAEMQEDIEDINDILKTMREQGLARVTNSDLGTKRHYNLLRGKLALLRNVADELDARVLPPGSKPGDGDDTNVVHYVIEADDITSAIT